MPDSKWENKSLFDLKSSIREKDSKKVHSIEVEDPRIMNNILQSPYKLYSTNPVSENVAGLVSQNNHEKCDYEKRNIVNLKTQGSQVVLDKNSYNKVHARVEEPHTKEINKKFTSNNKKEDVVVS